jgi:hypothetical protein
LAAASREHYFIPLAIGYSPKSLRILHEISEQIRVMSDHHRQEYVSSIDQNLGQNDDFHVTESQSKLVESREFRVIL